MAHKHCPTPRVGSPGELSWATFSGHPWTVSSNSQSVLLLPERPVLRSGHISLGCHNRCVLNAAPHLSYKLPVFLTLAIASLQLGHQPLTPPRSPAIKPRIRFTSVHLVVRLSLLPGSHYPSAGHQRLPPGLPQVPARSSPGLGLCSSPTSTLQPGYFKVNAIVLLPFRSFRGSLLPSG